MMAYTGRRAADVEIIMQKLQVRNYIITDHITVHKLDATWLGAAQLELIRAQSL